MAVLEPIEPHLRSEERLDEESDVVVRGWPLTVEGLLANAAQSRQRFSWEGRAFVAVSAEATVGDRTVDDLLSGVRLRTRKRYAAVRAGALLAGRFGLLPTFAVPHYSIVLSDYTSVEAKRLMEVLGDVHHNPHFVGRMR